MKTCDDCINEPICAAMVHCGIIRSMRATECGRFKEKKGGYLFEESATTNNRKKEKKIFCENSECIYCNCYICENDKVKIGENNKCESFKAYRNMQDYLSEYWIKVTAKTEQGEIIKARLKAYGRKIIICNRAFYTESSPFSSDTYTYVTDEKTGEWCGSVESVRNESKEFWDELDKYPDIVLLPQASEVEDESGNKHFVVEDGKKALPQRTYCSHGEGVTVRPDGVHELSPHAYKLTQKLRNVTVEVLTCETCGDVSVAWYRQDDTEEAMNNGGV